MSADTLETILGEQPRLLMIGGPPLYLAGFKVSELQTRNALDSLQRIVEAVPHVILEHHLLRDESWRQKTNEVFYAAYKSEHIVQTAAEFLGTRNAFLEASRMKLYKENPPAKDFEAWMRLSEEAKKHSKPIVP